MTKASIIEPSGGDVVHLGPITMRILEDGSTTAHRLGIAEITIAPHTGGPPQHRHGRHDEGFYVVAGTARFTLGGGMDEAPYEAPAGTSDSSPTSSTSRGSLTSGPATSPVGVGRGLGR